MGNSVAAGARDADPLELWTADEVANVLDSLDCARFGVAVRGVGFDGAAVKAILLRELDAVQRQWDASQAERERERKARRLADAVRKKESDAQCATVAAARAELGEERRRRAEAEAEGDAFKRELVALAERLGAAQQECRTVRQALAAEARGRAEAEAEAAERRAAETELEVALAEAQAQQRRLERAAGMAKAKAAKAKAEAAEHSVTSAASARAVAEGEAAKEAAEGRFLGASLRGLQQAAAQLQEAKRALETAPASAAHAPSPALPSQLEQQQQQLLRQQQQQLEQQLEQQRQLQEQGQLEEVRVRMQVRAAASAATSALAAAQRQAVQRQDVDTSAAADAADEQLQLDDGLGLDEALMHVTGAAITPMSRSPHMLAQPPPPSPPLSLSLAARQNMPGVASSGRSFNSPYAASPGFTVRDNQKLPRRAGEPAARVPIAARADRRRAAPLSGRAPLSVGRSKAGGPLVGGRGWNAKGGGAQPGAQQGSGSALVASRKPPTGQHQRPVTQRRK